MKFNSERLHHRIVSKRYLNFENVTKILFSILFFTPIRIRACNESCFCDFHRFHVVNECEPIENKLELYDFSWEKKLNVYLVIRFVFSNHTICIYENNRENNCNLIEILKTFWYFSSSNFPKIWFLWNFN